MPQLDEKKIGKGTRKGRLMSINGSGSRRVGTNSSNEDVFFTFLFYLINFCLSKAGICSNNQGKANKEEAENIRTSGVDKLSTGGAAVEKDPCTGKADTEESPGTGGADKSGIGKADKLGTGGADKPGTGRADKPGKGGADKPGTGGADKPGTSGANKPGTGRASKPDIGEADKPDTGGANKP